MSKRHGRKAAQRYVSTITRIPYLISSSSPYTLLVYCTPTNSLQREIHVETPNYHPTPSWRSLKHSNDPSEPVIEMSRTSIEISRSGIALVRDDDDESSTTSFLNNWALHYLVPTSASRTSQASVSGHLNEHKKGVHHRLHHRHQLGSRHHDEDKFEYSLDARTMAVRSSRQQAVEDDGGKGKDGFATVLRPVKGLSWSME